MTAAALGGASRRVDCIEAWAHVEVEASGLVHRAALSAPPEAGDSTAQPPKYIHFIATKPLTGSSRDLAWCALESAVRLCAETAWKEGASPEVRLWVENHSGGALAQLEEQLRLRGLRDAVTLGSFSSRLERNAPGILPGCGGLCKLEAWIARKRQARQQYEPALWSDAYRIAILGRYGGLYLDLDMVPLDPGVLRIPDGSLVLQDHAALAFVVNGGAIRLDKGHPFLALLEQDWLRYGDLYQESPRWGFLGPAQLTRAYLRAPSGMVRLYSAHLFEPRSIKSKAPNAAGNAGRARGSLACIHIDESIAVHFSGRAKDLPSMPELSEPCVASRLSAACPRTSEVCRQDGWGAISTPGPRFFASHETAPAAGQAM